jgi:hypothetical protein
MKKIVFSTMFIIFSIITINSVAFAEGHFNIVRPFGCPIEGGTDLQTWGQLSTLKDYQNVVTSFSDPPGTQVVGVYWQEVLAIVGDSVDNKWLATVIVDDDGQKTYFVYKGMNIDSEIKSGKVKTIVPGQVVGTVKTKLSVSYGISWGSGDILKASYAQPPKHLARTYGTLYFSDNRWPGKANWNPSPYFKGCKY